MACCGQNRQSWREMTTLNQGSGNAQPGEKNGANETAPAGNRTAEARTSTIQNPTVLYHLGDSSLLVKGEASNTTYLFGGRGTSLEVDERDVPALVAMRCFSTLRPER